jgi:NADH-quinone oxidoreductase subunit I/electron transport complex protein RnfC
MSCGLCAEVCPFDAIKMDHEFELATDLHHGMTIDKAGLNRPVSYYQKIAPTFWDEVKDGAYKKLQNNMKKRPDQVGIALQKQAATHQHEVEAHRD